jgi:hypothetical protein
MSLTPSEKVTICKILKIDALTLDKQLIYWGPSITDEAYQGIRDEMTKWTGGIGDKFLSMEPTESNEGIRLSSGDAKAEIISNIANALFFEPGDIGAGSGSSEFAIERG